MKDSTNERVRAFGRGLSAQLPVDHNTPSDMLKLLERLG